MKVVIGIYATLSNFLSSIKLMFVQAVFQDLHVTEVRGVEGVIIFGVCEWHLWEAVCDGLPKETHDNQFHITKVDTN